MNVERSTENRRLLFPWQIEIRRAGQTGCRGLNNRLRGARASDILETCTALMGTAAADRLPGANRGQWEPGARPSGPDHPGAAGRTAPAGTQGRSRPGRRSLERAATAATTQPIRSSGETAKEGGTAGPRSSA